MAVLLILPVH
jgi:hypothetical protein